MRTLRSKVKLALVLSAAFGALIFAGSSAFVAQAADVPEGFKTGELAPPPLTWLDSCSLQRDPDGLATFRS